jgi:hypothetical protein
VIERYLANKFGVPLAVSPYDSVYDWSDGHYPMPAKPKPDPREWALNRANKDGMCQPRSHYPPRRFKMPERKK